MLNDSSSSSGIQAFWRSALLAVSSVWFPITSTLYETSNWSGLMLLLLVSVWTNKGGVWGEPMLQRLLCNLCMKRVSKVTAREFDPCTLTSSLRPFEYASGMAVERAILKQTCESLPKISKCESGLNLNCNLVTGWCSVGYVMRLCGSEQRLEVNTPGDTVERGLQEWLSIRQVIIVLVCQLVLAMLHVVPEMTKKCRTRTGNSWSVIWTELNLVCHSSFSTSVSIKHFAD